MAKYACKTNRGQGANLCMLAGALMHGNKTVKELMETTGIDKGTTRHALTILCENGLAYKHSLRPHELREDGTYQSGQYPVVYAFNNPPFANTDFNRS